MHAEGSVCSPILPLACRVASGEVGGQMPICDSGVRRIRAHPPWRRGQQTEERSALLWPPAGGKVRGDAKERYQRAAAVAVAGGVGMES